MGRHTSLSRAASVANRPTAATQLSATAVRVALRRHADAKRAAVLQRFFKTAPGEYGAGDRFLGIGMPVLRRLAREFHELPLASLDRLLMSAWHEERALALLIMVRRYARGDGAERDSLYRLYVRRMDRVNNWDLVDMSAEHIVGARLEAGGMAALQRLARSDSVWRRRIAVLATFRSIKRREFGPTFRVAEWLVDDPHDLIQKAVGWMLREIGQRDLVAERQFLDRHAAHMPRVMLRYAIERFPEPLRQRYLAVRRQRRT